MFSRKNPTFVMLISVMLITKKSCIPEIMFSTLQELSFQEYTDSSDALRDAYGKSFVQNYDQLGNYDLNLNIAKNAISYTKGIFSFLRFKLKKSYSSWLRCFLLRILRKLCWFTLRFQEFQSFASLKKYYFRKLQYLALYWYLTWNLTRKP